MTTPSVSKPHYALFIFDKRRNLLLSSKGAEEINNSLKLVNMADNHMTSINGIRDDLLGLAINSVEDGNVMEFTLPIESMAMFRMLLSDFCHYKKTTDWLLPMVDYFA